MNDLLSKLAIQLLIEADTTPATLPYSSIALTSGPGGVGTSIVGKPGTESDLRGLRFISNFDPTNNNEQPKAYKMLASLLFYLGNEDQQKAFEDFAKQLGIQGIKPLQQYNSTFGSIFGYPTGGLNFANAQNAWEMLKKIITGESGNNPIGLLKLFKDLKTKINSWVSGSEREVTAFASFLESLIQQFNAYTTQETKALISTLITAPPTTGAAGGGEEQQVKPVTKQNQEGQINLGEGTAQFIALLEFAKARNEYLKRIESNEKTNKQTYQSETRITTIFLNILKNAFQKLISFVYGGPNEFERILKNQPKNITIGFLEKAKNRIYSDKSDNLNEAKKAINQTGIEDKVILTSLNLFYNEIQKKFKFLPEPINNIKMSVSTYKTKMADQLLKYYTTGGDYETLKNMIVFQNPTLTRNEVAPQASEEQPEIQTNQPVSGGSVRRPPLRAVAKRKTNQTQVTENYIRKCIIDKLLQRNIDFSLIVEEQELVLFKQLIETEAKIIKNKQSNKDLLEHKNNINKFKLLTGFEWPVEDSF